MTSLLRSFLFDLVRTTRDALDRALEREAIRRAPDVLAERYGFPRSTVDAVIKLLGASELGAVDFSLRVARVRNGDPVRIAEQMKDARGGPPGVVSIDCGNPGCENCSKRRAAKTKSAN